MSARIELSGVSKAFGPVQVLAEVDCAFAAGTVTAVLGANGAGKSTLLKIMGGVLAPSAGAGAVRAGEPLRPVRNVREALAAGVRFVHQEGSLIPAWTVAEHFAGGEDGWAELAPGLAGGTRVEQLGAHDRQLIEVARALEGSPAAVLADEPTAGLAPAERDRVFARLRAAAAKGAAVAMVTHDLDAALALADRILVLRAGRIARDAGAASLTRADILEAMGAAAVAPAARAASEAPDAAPALALPLASPGAAIGLQAGAITGLIGGPWSGAAEAVRAASGLPPLGASARRPGRRRAAYLSREMAEWDFPGLPTRFNLNAATWSRLARRGTLSRRGETAQAQALREAFRVTAPSLDHPIELLSGGNRQKAVLARLAAAKPAVLLLDEPFSGVDAPTRLALGAELRQLAAAGMAIGVYSQELADLAAACDLIAVAGDDGAVVWLAAAEADPAAIEAVLAAHARRAPQASEAAA